MSPYFSRSHHGWPPADLRACLLFLFQPQPLSLLPATQILARQRHHGQQGPGCRTVQGAPPSSRESGGGTIGAGGGAPTAPCLGSLAVIQVTQNLSFLVEKAY